MYNFDKVVASANGNIAGKPPGAQIFRAPFRMIISGSSGAGKTNFLFNMLFTFKDEWEVNWNMIYIFAYRHNEPKYNWLIKVFDKIECNLSKKYKKEVKLLRIFSDPEDIVELENVDSELKNIVVFDDLVNVKHKAFEKSVEDLFKQGR